MPWLLTDEISKLVAVLRLRRERGLTQEQIEARSGFRQQYLSDLERGRRNPTVITLYELAQSLGVSHVALVEPDCPSDVD